MSTGSSSGSEQRVDVVAVSHGGAGGTEPARPELVSSPKLAALRGAGTRHIYADTADVEELREAIEVGPGRILAEVDGNTANQPLVHKVVDRYLAKGDPRSWSRGLSEADPGLEPEMRLALLYAIVCGRVGGDVVRAFAAGRPWEVSLQIHMGLRFRPDAARRVGRLLRRMVPSAIVKVPFAPDAPGCFLVARDLEREGIPVNFTSTFSARQAVAAALLTDAARTNVFMGRLTQGMEAELLGEHVDLEAQRALSRLRDEAGTKTELIVASIREWQTFARLAGADVFTAPCGVLADFLAQDEVGPPQLLGQLETSYEDRLGISGHVSTKLGSERIARLWRVEPELVEFLREYRATPEYAELRDGEALFKRLDEAGFGDLFHVPDAAETEELARGKLPDLEGVLVERVPLDTHYSLLANADFDRHQAEIDQRIREALEG